MNDKVNYPEVTRIEVIDNYGRAFVRYYAYEGVTLVLQDDKRTLKVFASEPRITPPGPKWPDVPELPGDPDIPSDAILSAVTNADLSPVHDGTRLAGNTLTHGEVVALAVAVDKLLTSYGIQVKATTEYESVELPPDSNEPNTSEKIEELQKHVIMLTGWLNQLQKDIDRLKPQTGPNIR